jgi:predicted secreted protein
MICLGILAVILLVIPQSLSADLYYGEPPIYISWLLKVDSIGDTLWSRTYDKELSLNHVQQTADGGYILTGSRTSEDTYYLLLLKTDSLGDTLWSRTYKNYERSSGCTVEQTRDGGYIILGGTDASLPQGTVHFNTWVLRVNTLGDTLWTRLYDRLWEQHIQETSDGGYILIGNQMKPSKFDGFELYKLDSVGNEMWSRTYAKRRHSLGGNFVEQTSDGGYIITGRSKRKLLLLKLDSSGKKIWVQTWGGEVINRGYCVHETQDEGYIISAEIDSYFHLIKTNSSGKTLWKHNYSEEHHGWARCVQLTNDGNYIAIGCKEAKAWLLKTDTQGNTMWERTDLLGPRSNGHWIEKTTEGNYTVLASEEVRTSPNNE